MVSGWIKFVLWRDMHTHKPRQCCWPLLRRRDKHLCASWQIRTLQRLCLRPAPQRSRVISRFPASASGCQIFLHANLHNRCTRAFRRARARHLQHHGYVGWRVRVRLTPLRVQRCTGFTLTATQTRIINSQVLNACVGFQDWFKKVRIGFGDLFKLQQQQQQQPGSATHSFIHAGCERIPRMNK